MELARHLKTMKINAAVQWTLVNFEMLRWCVLPEALDKVTLVEAGFLKFKSEGARHASSAWKLEERLKVADPW